MYCMDKRKYLHIICLDKDAFFLVYHKDLSTGSDVSCSLYIHDVECLKYDCQGLRGHFHIYLDSTPSHHIKISFPRSMLSETLRKEQIDYVVSHIPLHLKTYLSRSSHHLVRRFQIDQHTLHNSLTVVRNIMLRVLMTYRLPSL